MKARTAYHRNSGKTLAVMKNNVLSSLLRVESSINSSAAILNGIASITERNGTIISNLAMQSVKASGLIMEKLDCIEELLPIANNEYTDNCSTKEKGKIESIFLCMRAINRLEDILLDHDYPSTPAKKKDSGFSANLNHIRSDKLVEKCLDCLPKKIADRLTKCHSLDGKEDLIARFEMFCDIQVLRKDIICHISRNGCAEQPVQQADIPD